MMVSVLVLMVVLAGAQEQCEDHGHFHSHDHDLLPSVTLLGTGYFGSAVARVLAAAHHDVHVWNRSPDKARLLEEQNGHVAAHESLQEALDSGGTVLLTCLGDVAAERELLAPMTFPPNMTWVQLSRATPREVREAAAWAGSKGLGFVSVAAGALNSASMVGSKALILFASGELGGTAGGVLEALGSVLPVEGPADRAAALDAALSAYHIAALVGLQHAAALAASERIAPHVLAQFVAALHPGLGQMAETSLGYGVAGEHAQEGDKMFAVRSATAAVAALERQMRDSGMDRGLMETLARLLLRVPQSGGVSQLAKTLASK